MDEVKQLESLRMERNEVRKIIQHVLSKSDDEGMKNLISLSTVTSIRSSIKSIFISSVEKNGYFIFQDEINPYALASYLKERKNYIEDYEIIVYYACKSLQKQINRFYKEIREGNCPVGRSIAANRKQLAILMNGVKERLDDDVKIIRV